MSIHCGFPLDISDTCRLSMRAVLAVHSFNALEKTVQALMVHSKRFSAFLILCAGFPTHVVPVLEKEVIVVERWKLIDWGHPQSVSLEQPPSHLHWE